MKRRLGVNIDHIATLRQARGVRYPDPVEALAILKARAVDQVTVHLREDRRHIQDHDVKRLVALKKLPVNLELAVSEAMLKIALQLKPKTVTFVPEKRQEVTTEGGLDCVKNARAVAIAVARMKKAGIHVSLFIDPDSKQTQMASELGADAVEFHTGAYCHLVESYFGKFATYKVRSGSPLTNRIARSLKTLAAACRQAARQGLKVYAGHGLHVHNLAPIVKIPEIEEYNIGHAIIAQAVFVGLDAAIREIQDILRA